LSRDDGEHYVDKTAIYLCRFEERRPADASPSVSALSAWRIDPSLSAASPYSTSASSHIDDFLRAALKAGFQVL
jgi:hypothetical protein